MRKKLRVCKNKPQEYACKAFVSVAMCVSCGLFLHTDWVEEAIAKGIGQIVAVTGTDAQKLKKSMAEANIETLLEPYRAAVKEQGDIVKKLKDSKGDEIELKKAVSELKIRKKKLEDQITKLTPKEHVIDRLKMEDLLKRRFFYDQSFSIYGGVTGLYDYGPMGCAIKANVLAEWRRHFILEEQMLEVDCSMLTPEIVLRASGHVERFSDYMVKDVKTGECYRADHLIEGEILTNLIIQLLMTGFILGHLEKLLKAKDINNEKKDEIERLLPQIDNMKSTD
ncbi:unnamed protein product, partial [Didymodactylos carnosus]